MKKMQLDVEVSPDSVNTMCWNKATEGGLGWVLDPPFSTGPVVW